MTRGRSADLPHVVVVGGGFGGMSVVAALARTQAHITLIDRRNHHLFQPLLYEVATAALSPAEIAVPLRHIFRKQKNVGVILGEVTSVDLERNVVGVDGDEVAFDYLVLATGSTHHYFGNDSWSAYAPGLKTIDDALEIRRRFLLTFERAERCEDPEERQRLLTTVIVGGGPTGIELAGTMSEVAKRVLQGEFRSLDPSS
ncbi:MAG: FAD-dependent oxidoreductase, partial [Pseudomonadota bacterium]